MTHSTQSYPLFRQDIFIKYIKVFRFFGIIPYKIYDIQNTMGNEQKFIRCFITTFSILAFLTFYWIGFIFAFLKGRLNVDIISRTINHLQMIMSAIAMTTIFVAAIKNIKIFNAIIFQKFQSIDRDLQKLSGRQKDIYSKDGSVFIITIIVSLIYLFLYQTVNYYIHGEQLYQPIWYYVVTNIPMIFYSMAMVSAFLMIHFLKTRCLVLNEIILRFDQCAIADDEMDMNVKIQNILIVLNHIFKLNDYISKYFGPMLLTTLATIFTIATVQSYYVYWTIVNFNQYEGFSSMSLIQEIMSCVTCFILLLGITNVCEGLSNSMRAITSNLSKIISKTNNNIEVYK